MPSRLIAVPAESNIAATIVKSGCSATSGRLPPGEYELLRGDRRTGTSAVLSPKRHGRDAEWVYYFVSAADVWAEVRELNADRPADAAEVH